MSVVKLENKVQRYAEEGLVSLTSSSFSSLCRKAKKAFPDSEASPAEKDVTAKLFCIIGRQGKSAAATSLFKNYSQLEALSKVSWSDIDWYANHPKRASISGMYNLIGFPNRNEVDAFEIWIDRNGREKESSKLFSSITGMQAGRGVPKESELNALKSWCEQRVISGDNWGAVLVRLSAKQEGIPPECLRLGN